MWLAHFLSDHLTSCPIGSLPLGSGHFLSDRLTSCPMGSLPLGSAHFLPDLLTSCVVGLYLWRTAVMRAVSDGGSVGAMTFRDAVWPSHLPIRTPPRPSGDDNLVDSIASTFPRPLVIMGDLWMRRLLTFEGSGSRLFLLLLINTAGRRPSIPTSCVFMSLYMYSMCLYTSGFIVFLFYALIYIFRQFYSVLRSKVVLYNCLFKNVP